MSDTLDKIIKSATVSENLYVTNLRLSTPQKDLSIDPKDLIDEDIVEEWSSEGARCRFSLRISDEINGFVDRMTVKRRQILQYLMFDGHNFLMFESRLNDYLESCKSLDNEFAEQLDEILLKWDVIRADFEMKLTDKMQTAVKKSTKSVNMVEIEKQVNQAVESYMSRKFPTEEQVRDRCGVFFDTPRLFKQSAPMSLSPEAAEAYEKSQLENIKIIAELLVNDYISLELDVIVGFLEEVICVYRGTDESHIKYGVQKIKDITRVFNADLVSIMESGVIPVGIEDSQSTTDEFNLTSSKTTRSRDDNENSALLARLAELNNSEGIRKYNVHSYRSLIKRCQNILENIVSSIPMLEKVSDRIDDLKIMKQNLEVFDGWISEWMTEYEKEKNTKSMKTLAKKETKKKSTSASDNQIVISDFSEPEIIIEPQTSESNPIINMGHESPKESNGVVVTLDDTDEFTVL